MGMTPECFPLPVDNITLLRSEIAPSWVSGPSIRGTSDILYSCILTLFLCVWTSIHLDIAPGRKSWENSFNRFFFMLLAMVFPELVLFYAFNEWSSVRQLCKSLNEAAKQHKSKFSFSMTYGFYVKMKGLCPNFDYSDGSHRKCYLSARGVIYLARRGIFFEVSEEFIEDKSKADALAKALVCLQVTWTVIQVISKKAVGYPISLLEVHTLAHVACALALYALWFKKPLGVREPTFLEKEGFRGHLHVFLDATHTLDQDDLESPRLLGPYIRELKYTIITKHLQSHTSTPRKLAFVLAVVCTTGAIYISAWNFVFPSKAEELLWRICSLTTVAVPVFVISVFLLTTFCLNSLLQYPRLRHYIKTVHSFISTYMTLMLALVVHCRTFLIVESFISIRHVPIGVYASVSWTKYIPHL